ncbi:type I restriction enzyme M protein [Glycomyces sambucus]|uniref:Type I restriction enzyme M protein n=1 Tax=Glycomyces sambucus TaxID=380244 RepID=A0A1G9MYL5_9ACTN|nr:N-6 DNA methylase [Glycomyces sambucus]SDL79319.1 type I restriction enzyme M protein [Glycomyces sambucus]
MGQEGLFEEAVVKPAEEPEAEPAPLAEDETIDFITGKRVKLKGAEPVVQTVARGLWQEYDIKVADMARNVVIKVPDDNGKTKSLKADIAIFAAGADHSDLKNLERVVVCRPEPSKGRTVTKIRTHEQAAEDLEYLKTLLSTDLTPNAHYGMWTNGLDFFFLHAEEGRFAKKFEPRAGWPLQGDVDSGTVASVARLRQGDEAMLKTAFRRCHNFVHGNEGLPKDAAFWQFLYLLFAKIHDERTSRLRGTDPRFFAYADEPFTTDGRRAIEERVLKLFEEVKQTYPLFGPRDEISLSPHALSFIVGELASYDLSGTKIDAKGVAYQELVGGNLRGDRGQYFTPRAAVNLMVEILDPKEDETVLDPACGTGGFLQETLRHLVERWRDESGITELSESKEQTKALLERLDLYAKAHLFGADFDPFLVRATKMSLMMMTGGDVGEDNIFHMNSLHFPGGHLEDAKKADQRIPFGSIDVVMTNPPFGTDIKIEEEEVLSQYWEGIARNWSRDKETGEIVSTGPSKAMAPEQLFIERAVKWVKPGGRIGIVLPNGILSNPGPSDEAVRRWILENCWVLASVELPVETFIHEAGVNILTTLLFLKRKTDREIMDAQAGIGGDYPVFMAVAEKVGIDRRGNEVNKRHPNGEVVMVQTTKEETIERNGDKTTHTLVRWEKAIDNDLPEIVEAYRGFRGQYPEPGSPR